LQIVVWKEPEVSVPSAVVRPDGRITVPLVKDVEVAGLTPGQAETVIAGGLGKFITDPNMARLDTVRSTYDPDGRFHSWMGRA